MIQTLMVTVQYITADAVRALDEDSRPVRVGRYGLTVVFMGALVEPGDGVVFLGRVDRSGRDYALCSGVLDTRAGWLGAMDMQSARGRL